MYRNGDDRSLAAHEEHDVVAYVHCCLIKAASIPMLLPRQRFLVCCICLRSRTYIKANTKNYSGENNRRWPSTWRLVPVPLLCLRWFMMLTVQHVNVAFRNGLSVHYTRAYCWSSVYLDAIDRALLIYTASSAIIYRRYTRWRFMTVTAQRCRTGWRNHFRFIAASYCKMRHKILWVNDTFS